MATRWKAIAMEDRIVATALATSCLICPWRRAGEPWFGGPARAFVSDVLEGCVDESRDLAPARLTRNGR
jgi:hypothetical protein